MAPTTSTVVTRPTVRVDMIRHAASRIVTMSPGLSRWRLRQRLEHVPFHRRWFAIRMIARATYVKTPHLLTL